MPEMFWDNAIIFIYFAYGLAFYSMGLALLVESGRSSELGFTRSLRLLAGFGILHGIHEWIDLLERAMHLYYQIELPVWMLWIRLAILVASFLALVAFGEHMLRSNDVKQLSKWRITGGVLLFYSFSAVAVQLYYQMSDNDWRMALDALARYLIGIPGSLLACYVLWKLRKVFLHRKMSSFARDLNWVVVALFIYGIVGQAFPSSSTIFPSTIINSDLFLRVFGFPVQVIRALMATIIAVATIRVLRALEVENQDRLNEAEQARIEVERRQKDELKALNLELRAAHAESERLLEEVRRRDARRGELLQRITAAQEAERQRIARELHDDTGQVLTGLALGLRGVSAIVDRKPQVAAERLGDLQDMATTAIEGLRHLIHDLRPPQLDDIGLIAALRVMMERLGDVNDVTIGVTVTGTPRSLPKEVETVLFRVTQEGVTNAVKHAHADQIRVELDFTNCLKLTIHDDGCGFDVDSVMDIHAGRTAWGLYGVQERARLVKADLQIESMPDEGTTLTVTLNNGYIGEQSHDHSDFDC